MSKMLKGTILVYLSLDTILTNLGKTLKKWRPLVQGEKAVDFVCNAYVQATKKNNTGTGLMVYFLRDDTLFEMNRLFISNDSK